MKKLPRGLYAVTDGRQGAALVAAVTAALRGGVVMVQYRDKTGDHARRYREARQLLALCRTQGVPLLINDDIALCGEVEADGVHLGADDSAPDVARQVLGDRVLIGLSCYNTTPDPAHSACADYLAFGALYPSGTKPQAQPVSLDWLRHMRRLHPARTLAAIGGIDATRIATVAATSIDLIAMVRGLFGHDDIEGMARTMSAQFQLHSRQ